MKKFILIIVFIFSSISLTGCSLYTSENTHPTKEEWLEIYVTSKIEDVTDLWGLRTSVNVAIFDKSKEIVVTITQSNQESAPNVETKQRYIDMAKSIAEGVIKNYNWASDYKLTVQFL